MSGVLGAVAFCAVQIPLLFLTPPIAGITDPGWFLNSGRNILLVVAVLFAGSAWLSLRKQGSEGHTFFYGAGAVTAMIVTLFLIGAGSIFPIVIVFGTALIAFVVFAGASCGDFVRERRGHAG